MIASQSHDQRRLRPSVEGLESLCLLSGLTHPIAVHPVAQVHAEATKAPTNPGVVHLHGTIHAIAHVASRGAVGAEVIGSGQLGAVGKATIDLQATDTTPFSTLILMTKRGQITLRANVITLPGGIYSRSFSSASSSRVPFRYEVSGGTGAYANSTGSGTVLQAILVGKGGKIQVNYTFF